MIRKYAEEDLTELLDIWYEASQIGHPFLTQAFFDQERKNIIQKYLPNAEHWVFEENGQVIGYIALVGNEVGALFVSPVRHRHGVGSALMNHAKGVRDYLEVEVFEANEVGRAFYNAYGFELIGKRIFEETGHVLLRLRLDY